ncbi:histone deacetylase 5 isoform X2 [Vitis vinifera]|uniref:histone deacetylase 5 isoform X2 n=1 Tax=Vitis vinifera TaxID=29760 RepID=UPI0001985194|nr:histone deacetylase 5 isoform X2 [Vitis vinifera]|eukprot:XP_010663245.1 PREDICTED: histone deacetylase 5 isoform X2 [Vitis vinifera]
MEVNSEKGDRRRRVGLVYDDRMCEHATADGDPHPENPDRIRAIWKKLESAGIPQRCVVFNAKEAEDKHILSVHSNNHVNLIKNISSKQFDSRRNRIASKFNSIYMNEGSSEAAYLAAGSVIEVAERVAKGELSSAFAIVRPPGHHAEQNEPMGFCLYNNVAIATSFLLNERPDIKKILIVDWDVHHGNGTQKMFWKDPRVLFFSVHRHEFGSFYPANDEGFYAMTGEGPGAGYNINVPWENGRCGDADYLAVWDHILIPVAKDFNPDIVIISAGFDAAIGDPLGGCHVTPYGYSVMLKKLMEFSEGKIIMALEGGYNLVSLANSVLACVEVLLEDKPIAGSSEAYPFESTWRVIQAVRQELSAFWPTLADELPKKLTSCKASPLQLLVASSDSEDESDIDLHIRAENLEAVVQDGLSKLKVDEDSHVDTDLVATWRSELSKIDVWYASFGSNMWKSRFLCYIEGGQLEGMEKRCSGSVDRNPPKEIMWKTVPHRLFFGRDHSSTWGPGGVAFLNPEENNQDRAYICLYRITLEQFNDVLLQENASSYDISSPLFDLVALNSIADKQSISVEFKSGWYRSVLYLGKECDIPILTLTCPLSDVEAFKSGDLPMSAPSKEYANTIIRGLTEGKQLSEEEAIAYIQEASTKPL